MVKYEGAEHYVPEGRGLAELREAAERCRGCDLYADATQTVFGAGPQDARVVMVGEVPGDREDATGKPFVGPAGGLLDKAMKEAGIDRDGVYVTNAVKHFRFTPAERGKRRIHKKPSRGQIVACRPWLVAELEAVTPGVVVCLGATAAQSLLGTDFRVSKQRGELLDLPGGEARVLATAHPSAILRAPADDREQAYQDLVKDLRIVAKAT
ncbi:UdgX family uracil-DNA binding protein [Prauserella endophytica]|uniref:Type-4 uracil-DNA glycosylase n=1 Tax=Prauserella endophytica TaxID=1592324 RepID=A0ABY2RXD7_9PSEU|nr:UdgX family uracil-DNA binding protein [Prauserella endophytica]PXY20452.1 uracil-DNA glycosylase [Prauserella coralliicola]TKG63143.1 UdgX family uracil-DNA binding protein [Prauserella endophytica]